MKRAALPAPPRPEDFKARARGVATTSRVGMWLGICFALTFATGLISHQLQEPSPLLVLTRPVWGYRITQGIHVIAGTAAIPLLLVKLWSVFPHLFARPPRSPLPLVRHALERGSILVLVAGGIFMLASGLANAAQWYPFAFTFRATHYAVAWVTVGALLVHIAVKLPLIRQGLDERIERDDVASPATPDSPDSPDAPPAPAVEKRTVVSRRRVLRSTWVATGVAVLASAGSTVPALRNVSVFGVRSGDGPQDIPINKSARAAVVTASATSPDWALTVAGPDREVTLNRDDLAAMEQVTAELPIACVEGWSATGTWTGVRIGELLALVDAAPDSNVKVVSLQQSGAFAQTLMQGEYAADSLTLLALGLNGEALSLDHGYPCRLIAPNRPGVLQTKWVSRLEVLA